MVDLEAMVRGLADEPLAPPASLPELEWRVLRRTRQRRRRAFAATAAAVVVALPTVGLLHRDRGRNDLRVATAGATTVPTVADLGVRPPTTADGAAPTDGRLRGAYVTSSYESGSGALGSFRVDPAPDAVTPRMTEAEVLAAFDASDAAPRPSGSDYVTIVRFGLFSGSVADLPAAGGRLTGSYPIEGEPAWLVVFEGIRLRERDGVPNPDAPGSDRGASPIAPGALEPRIGHGAAVIQDSTGRLLSGYVITPGSARVR